MKSLIIYGNFARAANAEANIEFAAQLIGDTSHGKIKMCRAEVLKQSVAATKMLAETADAHLIVVALSRFEPLDKWLINWLETWAGRRLISDALLAVFEDEYSPALSQSSRRKLSRFTRRQGMGFILGDSRSVPVDAVVRLHSSWTRQPGRPAKLLPLDNLVRNEH